jgi:hypothetical protein
MSTIPQLFGGRAPQSDDDIILAPPSINPRSSPSLQPDEFKLQGKDYVRCSSLARNPKATKKRLSVIWMYGEDIQLRDAKNDPRVRDYSKGVLQRSLQPFRDLSR